MVLKIRDSAGNEQEILVIKGAKGRDYVLTDADKEEIAAAVLDKMQNGGMAIKNWIEQGYGLTEIVIPEGVTKVAGTCFQYYDALETVSLPSTLTEIGNSAFAGCTSLENIELPENLVNLYPRAFEDCTAIPRITIPAGVKNLYEYTFGWCNGLTEVTFKGTPQSMSENTFGKCTGAMVINVPWSEGAVANAPWGATNATINYNYVG